MLKLTSSPVSTQTPDNQLEVRIMPNPAHGLLTIRLGQTNGQWSWKLRSVAGQQLFQGQESNSTEAVLPLTGLPQGLYFVEIQSENGQWAIKKVVVE
jgi:hypothetical protein